MKTKYMKKIICFVSLLAMISLISSSCKKIKEFNYDPEIEPLKLGFQTSAAIGYCADVAHTFFTAGSLPGNVVVDFSENDKGNGAQSGILFIMINSEYPLPFNANVGQIAIAGIWGEGGGVITVLFTEINIIDSKYEFKGIHTIPVIELENGKIMTFFTQEDIVMGEGEDTIVNLQMGLASMNIGIETARLENEELPSDAFAAIAQKAWFITIDKANAASDIYDDSFTVYGGGQIAEVSSKSGGVLYHSMIGAGFIPDDCLMNPTSGIGFIQNLKVGDNTDLGHIFLNFNERCDGKAFIEVGTGKYLTSSHKDVNLNFYE
jgi:hypothetical protein